jgi:hypothetical protein
MKLETLVLCELTILEQHIVSLAYKIKQQEEMRM